MIILKVGGFNMQKNIYLVNYNSVRDFMATNASNINQNTWVENVKGHQEEGKSHLLYWYGFENVEGVIKICREGWVEGVQIYQAIKSSIPDIELSGCFHKKYKRKKKYSDSGDEVDIDKYIHNEIETMFIDQQKYIAEKHGKIITIYSSFAFNSNRSSKESLWMGITTCVLTDILESAGYRVEIVGFCALYKPFVEFSSPTETQFNINIKFPEQPLDLINVLMASAYPGFFRYFGFKTILASPYKCCDFLGKVVQNPYIRAQNSFLISDIWNSQDAYYKILSVLNDIKNRELNNLI